MQALQLDEQASPQPLHPEHPLHPEQLPLHPEPHPLQPEQPEQPEHPVAVDPQVPTHKPVQAPRQELEDPSIVSFSRAVTNASFLS